MSHHDCAWTAQGYGAFAWKQCKTMLRNILAVEPVARGLSINYILKPVGQYFIFLVNPGCRYDR